MKEWATVQVWGVSRFLRWQTTVLQFTAIRPKWLKGAMGKPKTLSGHSHHTRTPHSSTHQSFVPFPLAYLLPNWSLCYFYIPLHTIKIIKMKFNQKAPQTILGSQAPTQLWLSLLPILVSWVEWGRGSWKSQKLDRLRRVPLIMGGKNCGNMWYYGMNRWKPREGT